jgi:DNA-binding NarL/FixJ family response regulator
MGIGEKTVKSHVTAVIGKLRASGRTQVAVAVARAGLVEWEDN